jgi:hypothetical protein
MHFRRRLVAGFALAVLTGSAAAAPGPADAGSARIPLSSEERDDAWQFCLATVISARGYAADATKVCGCFPGEWERRSDRLERLALAIALAPDSPRAKSNVWEISAIQGGLNEDRLQVLSDAYRDGVRQSIAACRRS